MPFVTTAITAAGAGLSAAAGTAASIGSAVATGAQGLATVASLAGTGVSAYGQIQAGQASKEAEEVRRRQMMITAQRERRTAVRGAMQARATATSAGVANNAMFGSGLAGGIAQQSSDLGQKVSDTNTQETLGQQLFSANAAMSQGKTIASIGQGMNNFGKDLFAAGPAMGRIAATLTGPQDPWNTQVFPS